MSARFNAPVSAIRIMSHRAAHRATDRHTHRIIAGLVANALVGVIASHAAGAQSLLPSTGWGLTPTLNVWAFPTKLPQGVGDVLAIAEVAVPFRVRANVGRWRADLSGAAAFGGVAIAAEEGGHLAQLAGPTDVKLRVTGPLFGDANMITLGVNIPTGKVGLTSEQTSTLQLLAAPALQMPVATFGMGAGATVGVIHAFQGEGWALALGASGEKRAEYSPVALVLSAGPSSTQLTPGLAAHVTMGFDKTVGEGRLSLLVLGDVFTKDRLRFTDVPTDTSSNYTLGPQATLSAQYDMGTSGWRERTISAAARKRSAYRNTTGATVAGSSGTFLEGAINAVRGGPQGAGLVIGTDARWHSGMPFTDALVGAAVSAIGATIGVEGAGSHTATRFTVHAMYGSFDTGKTTLNGINLTLGFSIAARREAQ